MGEKATCDTCGAEVSASNMSRHKKKAHGGEQAAPAAEAGTAAAPVAAAAAPAAAKASKPAARKQAGKRGGTEEQQPLSPERRKQRKVMKDNEVEYRAYEKAHLDGKAGKLSEAEVTRIKAANRDGHKAYWRAYEADRALRKAEAAAAA